MTQTDASRGKARGALVLAGFLLGLPPAVHGDWPQWRGPARDGSVAVPGRGEDWPARLALAWVKDVGQGYSGPVVVRDRIWVHARRGEQEIVSSLDLGTGEELWTRAYPAPFAQDPSALAHGRGPYATPSLADGRLLTLGIAAMLSAWDADTGALLWKTDYSGELDPNHTFFGAAASPLVWGGLCFAHFGGHREEALGRPGRGAMVALSVADGSERWRWTGDSPALGASPIVQVIGGRPHLVFKARASIVSVDPLTGRELWRIPFTVAMDNTIVTPLFLSDVLVTSDYQKGMHAWRIRGQGDTWTPLELWSHREASLFTSSPVVAADLLVGLSELKRGQLFGLEPGTGRILWRTGGRWGEHASLIAWGDQVLVFREDGSLVVGEVSREGIRRPRRYSVGSAGLWAHPAVVDDRVIVRDGSRLAVYRLGSARPE